MKCDQRSSCDLTTLPFCLLQWNQSPPLPAPERKGPPQLLIGLIVHHHEFLPLLIFNNEPLHVHIASPPVLSGITVDNSSSGFFIRTETDTTTIGSCIIHPLHRRQFIAGAFPPFKGLRQCLIPLRKQPSQGGKQVLIQRVLLEKRIDLRISKLTRFRPIEE